VKGWWRLPLSSRDKQALLTLLTLACTSLLALAAAAFPVEVAVTAVAPPALQPEFVAVGRHPAPHPLAAALVYDNLAGLWIKAWAESDATPQQLIPAEGGFVHQAAFSPDGRYLVFARHTTEKQGLFILDLTTREERLLLAADPDTVLLHPTWSPTGDQIAFTRIGRSDVLGESAPLAQASVWIIQVDGTGLRRVTHGEHPTWSPDGRRLAVQRPGPVLRFPAVPQPQQPANYRATLRVVRPELWVVEPATGTARYVTTGGEPAWSPDGRYLAFIDYAATTGTAGDLLRSFLWLLTTSLGTIPEGPTLAGEAAARLIDPPRTVRLFRELWVIELASGRRQRLTAATQPLATPSRSAADTEQPVLRPGVQELPPDYGLHAEYDPAWGADGKTLFFASYLRESGSFEIFALPFPR